MDIIYNINKALSEGDIDLFFQLCNRGLEEDLTEQTKANIYFIMGCYYKDVNNYIKAVDSFKKSIEKDPKKLYSYIRLLELLIEIGNNSEAIEICNEAKEKFPGDEDLEKLQRCIVYPKEIKIKEKGKRSQHIIVGILIAVVIILAGLVVYLYRSSLQKAAKSEKVKSSSTINPKLDSKKDNENKTATKDVEKGNSNKDIKDKYLVNNEDPSAKFNIGNVKNTDFIFPSSDVIRLTYDEVMGKTIDELFIARNEMFARYGYEFSTIRVLNDYFKSKSWYFSRKDYNGDLNTEIEKANANIIKQVEFDRIAYYNYGNKEVDGQVISNSNTEKINKDEITNFSDWELVIAKNEIYARHGYEFGLVMLKDHFSKENWYVKSGGFKYSDLSDIEKENIDILGKEEEKRIFNALQRY